MQKNIAITAGRTDEKLNRQLLRVVSDGILVRTDIQPAYDGWYRDELGDGSEAPSGSRAPKDGSQRGERGV